MTSFMVTTSGLAEGHNTRAMFKRVKSKRDAKFFKQETIRHLRSSPHLIQETVTKMLKNSFSKGLKSRRAANKVLKSSPVSGRRRKWQHVDMESADSGSSGGNKVTLYIVMLMYVITKSASNQLFPVQAKLSWFSYPQSLYRNECQQSTTVVTGMPKVLIIRHGSYLAPLPKHFMQFWQFVTKMNF
jgi:hypothetical protein